MNDPGFSATESTWEFWLRGVSPDSRKVYRARGQLARDAWANAWREHNGTAFSCFTFRRVEDSDKHEPVKVERRVMRKEVRL